MNVNKGENMQVNCPKCKKSLVNDQIKRINKDYENKIIDSIKERIHNELREDFKKKLEEIDKRFSYNDTNLSPEIIYSRLYEERKQLENQKNSLMHSSWISTSKLSNLKREYEKINKISKLDYWKSLLRSLEYSLNNDKEYKKNMQIIEKQLEQLSKKRDEEEKKIALERKKIENVINSYNHSIRNNHKEIERLQYRISSIKEAIYNAKLEEEKWQQKRDVLKRALED